MAGKQSNYFKKVIARELNQIKKIIQMKKEIKEKIKQILIEYTYMPVEKWQEIYGDKDYLDLIEELLKEK